MSGVWRELSPTDSWFVSTHKPLQTAEVGVLMHLYQPIIGTDAVSLYMTLCMQGAFHTASESPTRTHRFLMGLLNLPLDQVLEARLFLEGIGLLKTFKYEEDMGRLFRYEVIPPLEPSVFFQQDVLSITLMNRLGKERFRQVRERFNPAQQPVNSGFADVTRQFQEVFTSLTPSELTLSKKSDRQAILADMEVAPAHETGTGPTFAGVVLDWDFLRAQASSIGSLDDLTEEEREKIREWAFFYQLDDLSLGKALQNPDIYDSQNRLDVKRLHEYIKLEYRFRHGQAPSVRALNSPSPRQANEENVGEKATEKEGGSVEEVHRQWLARLSPLELLERYQRGGKVPESDVKLVEKLYEQFGLPYPVINVLIEFVFFTHNYKLPAPLVEKIAGHWKRANPQTVEEAQELALQELYERNDHKNRKHRAKFQQRKSNGRTGKAATGRSKAKEKSEQAQIPAETEEQRRQRKEKFEKLLTRLQQARSKGE